MTIKYIIPNIILALIMSTAALAQYKPESQKLKLWYQTPADATVPDVKWNTEDATRTTYAIDKEWMKALPIGNGAFGAMVFGDINTERIQLNEESMWSGGFNLSDNPGAKLYLGNIRKMLFDGSYHEANKLTERSQIGINSNYNHADGATDPFGCFQTMGDLWIKSGVKLEYKNYRRELDLSDAVVRVNYTQNNVNFSRETFASNPHQVMVSHFTADKPGKISFKCSLTRPEHFKTYTQDQQLIMEGALIDGKGGKNLEYMVRVKIINKGGSVIYGKNEIEVKNANEVVILVSGSTSYLNDYPHFKGRDFVNLTSKNINAAQYQSYEELLAAHKKDYQKYFNRVSFNLDDKNFQDMPTDVRLERFKKTPVDPYLVKLIFQYGRYLLISSSRENTLAGNLQGIWANKIQTPWNGDYHPDINLQMYYWPAEVANLSEMHQPYFDYLASLVAPGTQTAATQYGLDGWVVHTLGNVWGYTSPGEKASWGMHVAATGWMCQHVMEHYRFTGDLQFLKKMYPVLKEASRFYKGWLVKNPKTGKLVSGPSISPENIFLAPDGTTTAFSMGSAHDQQVIMQLFSDYLEASSLLNINDDFLSEIKETRQNLASGWNIDDNGYLLEWAKELKETNPQSGHISHLFAFHPAAQITYEKTPELANAAYKSLLLRYNNEPKTGWSGAWLISQFARHKDPEHAVANLYRILAKDVHPNLFTSSPFQIDADFGMTAGIAELLIQSHADLIDLLPALPNDFKSGSVTGLKARGGFEVDIDWKNGKIIAGKVKSLYGQACVIRADRPFKINGIGSAKRTESDKYMISFTTESGKDYTLSII